MAERKTLKKALQQMAEGSRSGFHTFYLGSSQYIYSSALLLYDSHEDACRFMVDFYQYLYLHLPEYDRSASLENWISHLLMERYEQLSIGKNMPRPSVKQQLNSTAAQLSKSEQERIWRMLDVNIRFPKETVRRSPVRFALLVSVLLLLLLVASRYVPDALRKLQAASATSAGETSAASEEENGAENTEPGSDEAEQTDELDSIQDKLDDLLDERAASETDSETDNTDAFQQQQSGVSGNSDQTKDPESPAAPETPQEPDEPQAPQTPQEPAMSEGSDALSGTDDLENMELELLYGDSLRF